MTGAGCYNYEKVGAKDAMVTLCVMNLVEKYRSNAGITPRQITQQVSHKKYNSLHPTNVNYQV